MTTKIRPCPACGGVMEAAAAHGCYHAYCTAATCGLRGPRGDTKANAVARCNALPRWPDWRGADDPPEVPEGDDFTAVLGWLPILGALRCAFSIERGFTDLTGRPLGVTHWTPLPPAPGEKP